MYHACTKIHLPRLVSISVSTVQLHFSVVTMEGQLIDRSGIMSGGMNLNQHNGGKTIFKQSIRGSGTEGGAIEVCSKTILYVSVGL